MKTEGLTQGELQRLFKEVGDKESNVTDIGDFFVYQYSGKPSVFLSKVDGKLYSKDNDHLTRLQGIFFLQKLSKFNLVEGYKRIQKHRTFNIGW